MKIFTSSILWSTLFYSSLTPPITNAMFADEAGVNDFTISSAGHGYDGVTYAQLTSDGTAILTSSSTSSFDTFSSDSIHSSARVGGYDGCHLASRSLEDGKLLWRKNVCSTNVANKSKPATIRHAVYSDPNDIYVYTLDDSGVLRKWDETNGNLIHQESIDIGNDNDQVQPPQLYPLSNNKLACVISNQDGGLMFLYDTKQMKIDVSKLLLASSILEKTKVKPSSKNNESPQFLSRFDEEHILVGYVSSTTDETLATLITSLSQMAIVNVSTMDGKSVSAQKLGSVPLVVSTVKTRTNENNERMIIAMTNSDEKGIISLNISNKKETQINIDDLDSSSSDELNVISKEMNGFVANGIGLVSCNDKTITISNGSLNAETESSKSLALYHNNDRSETIFLKMLQCYNTRMTGLAMSRAGTTSVFDVIFNEESIITSVEKNWSAEESFGSITSATFLDFNAPQGIATANDDEEDAILESLLFASRLNAQYESLISFISGGFMEQVLNLLPTSNVKSSIGQKDLVFGLKKVSVMLSNPFSKVMGIDTASNGEIIWSMNLNSRALWHKVVHGAASSHSSVFGHGMHHPHSPELLILSQLNGAVEWKCVDGLSGRTISESNIDLSLPIVQILPIHAHSHAGGGCKQNAILILEDNSFVVVPQTPQSVSDTYQVIESGLYSHTVNKEKGLFTTMKLGNNSQQSVVIGETLFDPKMEKIINIVYPQRNEVVQSPATILGDDSLLLKYLNPHICVIVTEATEEMIQELENAEENSFYDALASSKSGSGSDKKQKIKPLGATKPGEDVPKKSKTPIPTLFVNLVDTVSGQILHRTSHAHIAPGAMLANDATVPVVISENWIVYAFTNAKSRRTELGVITLHEGMIDKQGITAFSTPEQQEIFSSLTSAKPYALTKTFALSVPVSAIGVTNTKNGISSKNILLATGPGGQIIRIDRRLLDPRRPSGEPKDTEKKEGLMQYAPFLPIPPMATLSYTNKIEEVSSIQSTAANLESQTLVIAYGGPDIFFTRYAPSKGFDSLPESFNKFAIIMVLIALFAALQYLKKASQKKRVQLGWS